MNLIENASTGMKVPFLATRLKCSYGEYCIVSSLWNSNVQVPGVTAVCSKLAFYLFFSCKLI